MSDADARSRAVPTETDIAFAKALKGRRTGADREAPGADVAIPETPPAEGGSNELAVLRAELAELRKIVQSQNKAPTSARRIGEVADAELAAETADRELAAIIDEATERAPKDKNGEVKKDANGVPLLDAKDQAKIQELRKRVRKLTQEVDVARALAGLIPMTHPGLKYLPPEHPVFRVK
jgi:hypothetical protein